MPNLLYEQAVAGVTRAPDGSYREDDLIAELIKLINIDTQREKAKKAKRIIDNLAKPGATEPDGQLCLPGLAPYDFEPERLVRDEYGNVVENQMASPSFKTADARRARKHAREASEWSDRKSEEQEIFGAWAMKQVYAGRPAAEITWGNCVKELGLWNAPIDPKPVDPPGVHAGV